MFRIALCYVTPRADTFRVSPLRDTATVGKRIKAARVRKGLTQEELAEILHTSKASVSNWERDKHSPEGVLPRLEDALDVSLTEGEEERVAESYTLEAVLDRLRAAERELDRARAVVRRIIAEGQD